MEGDTAPRRLGGPAEPTGRCPALRCAGRGPTLQQHGRRLAGRLLSAETPADAAARGGEEEATTGGPEEQKLLSLALRLRGDERCVRERALQWWVGPCRAHDGENLVFFLEFLLFILSIVHLGKK